LKQHLYLSLFLIWLLGQLTFLPCPVYADIFGKLHFVVINKATGQPISLAKITLEDSAGIHPNIVLYTNNDGVIDTPPLDARTWIISVEANGFEPDFKEVTVVASTTTNVIFSLETIKETVFKIKARRKLIETTVTQSSTSISRQDIQLFPATALNPQSLQQLLVGQPGMVQDSVNQVHPRGEHSATTIFINGFELPDVLQGRVGQLISPQAVQNLNLITGAFAPEYGGETAAILDMTLRSGPSQAFGETDVSGGSFNTYYGEITSGGQFGTALGPPDEQGNVTRAISYFFDASARNTQNMLEPPQPDNQTAHNAGLSQIYFGHMSFYLDSQDRLDLILNSAPAFAQIANRTGLPSFYAPFGQGWGFGGHLSQAQAETQGIGTQQQDGQNIFQKDLNGIGVITWRHDFNDNLQNMLGLGYIDSESNINNENPTVNLLSLPADNSIEYNPTILRRAYHYGLQDSITYYVGNHTFKAGLLDDEQTGRESYNLIPASQLALDALAFNDPLLAPLGTETSTLDAIGNPVYILAAGAAAPTLNVNKAGFYRAGYIQDTWNATHNISINYGFRFDWYKQAQNLGQPPVSLATLSPRINTSFGITPDSVLRLSFDRLFIEPPLTQGAIVGQSIVPETLSQYEASYEYQLSSNQKVKLDWYYKDIRNQIDTGLLIPDTQIGVYTSVNFQFGAVHGLEFSYEFLPSGKTGPQGDVFYTYQVDAPSGIQNTGAPVPEFNDHDERDTVGADFAYVWPNGSSFGITYYYGSGTFSSEVTSFNGLITLPRVPHAQVDLSYKGPNITKNIGWEIDVYNLLNSRKLIDWESGFDGTRFQQGRFILGELTAHF
jgi:outer membrane receptor protein involved in Fe transport